MNKRRPLSASDALPKGTGSWMQFQIASLPYFISPFVKRPHLERMRQTEGGPEQGIA